MSQYAYLPVPFERVPQVLDLLSAPAPVAASLAVRPTRAWDAASLRWVLSRDVRSIRIVRALGDVLAKMPGEYVSSDNMAALLETTKASINGCLAQFTSQIKRAYVPAPNPLWPFTPTWGPNIDRPALTYYSMDDAQAALWIEARMLPQVGGYDG